MTKNELMRKLAMAKAQKRVCEFSPEAAAALMAGYTMVHDEGFGAGRVVAVSNRIAELQNALNSGEIDMEELRIRIFEKADFDVDYARYGYEEITAKPGTVEYILEKYEIESRNIITIRTAQYFICFYTALIDLYGYGKKRLNRVCENVNELLRESDQRDGCVEEWQKYITDKTGIEYENIFDAINRKYGKGE